MKFVRLEGNKVVEVIPDYALPLDKYFNTDFISQCIEAPDNVEQHYFYDRETDTFSEVDTSITLDDVIESKLSELSNICEDIIIGGTGVELSIGVDHFDYDIKDQINIKEMYDAIKDGASMFPYRAADGSCHIYDASDIIKIYTSLAMFKTSILTYFYQLREYVRSLNNIKEVESIEWGIELAGIYLDKYNEAIYVANAQMESIISKFMA